MKVLSNKRLTITSRKLYNKNMKKQELNKKLEDIYRYTVEYISENGFPPSVREICAKFNIKSTATAYSYIEKLKEKGLLVKSPLKKRAIKISQFALQNEIPLIGEVRAGFPIFAVENLDGYYPLPPDFGSKEDFFALRVKGNSMIKVGIYDKDVIIVKKQNYAENDEIIVALIEDSATVKRFFLKNNTIVLHPENDEMEDMCFENVNILGIVKGLYRKF